MIPFEYVPENLYELYNIVGAELFTKIVDVHGGEMLYIPKRSTMERKKKHESIRKEYDGTNISHLAMKYGYTERTVQNILYEGDSK
jgi:Mor family transcriptional regulator